MNAVKKPSAMVFCLSSDHVFALATLMLNIKHVNPQIASEYVVFHNGVSIKDRNIIRSILPTRFIKYRFPIKDVSSFDKGTITYFSPMVFAKFECFRLLDEYETVIYSDYDIVLCADIAELLIPVDVGIRAIISKNSSVADQFHALVPGYDLERPGISMALFVLFSTFPNHNIFYQECYKKTREYASVLKLPEQAVVDMLLQDHKLTIASIDQDIYCCYPGKALPNKEPKIYHAWGQPKFWNGLSFPQWDQYYHEWLSMGGSRAGTEKLHAVKVIVRQGLKQMKALYHLPRKTFERLSRPLTGYNDLIDRIDEYYALPRHTKLINDEIRVAIANLKAHGFSSFPNMAPSINKKNEISVFRSQENGMPFVDHCGKPLYLKAEFSDARAREYYDGLREEQRQESPHRYLARGFSPDENDVVMDIGAAEANFSLDVVERASHVIIFEGDKSWVRPLQTTFKPYANKVTIIDEYFTARTIDAVMDRYPQMRKYLNSVSFIKMDVEGAELDVLCGLKSILNKNNPLRLLICSYHNQGDEEKIKRFLGGSFSVETSSGYMLYPWRQGKMVDTPPYFRRGVIRASRK